MALDVTFRKSGQAIIDAIGNRVAALQARLDKRNESLDALLDDRKKLRSYLVRSSQYNVGHGSRGQYMLVGDDDIASEEKEEIDQMLRRIFEVEQEIRRLKLIAQHIDPTETFELKFNDLVSYGFDLPDV